MTDVAISLGRLAGRLAWPDVRTSDVCALRGGGRFRLSLSFRNAFAGETIVNVGAFQDPA